MLLGVAGDLEHLAGQALGWCPRHALEARQQPRGKEELRLDLLPTGLGVSALNVRQLPFHDAAGQQLDRVFPWKGRRLASLSGVRGRVSAGNGCQA